tara:strand:+ start:753 stop:1049 length:297 start_codon:yes stop_codon:yes gene_type:complete
MNTLLRYLLLIPIAFFWLYYMIGVVSLFLIFIGLFLNIFFPSLSVLDNLLTMLNTFGDNGFVGLIALIFLVGQYFLAYHFYLILSTYRKKLKNEIHSK